MKKSVFTAFLVCMIFALSGCGGGGSNAPPVFETLIYSDPGFDGDIEQTTQTTFVVTQGMSPTVQSVFAGIDPVTFTETRAFLDFPIRGPGGIPNNAIIDSAFLDIVIKSIKPTNVTIPVRIELVNLQTPTLFASDFSRSLQPPLKFTTIIPPISPADAGNPVSVNVTSLLAEAQNLGFSNFQLRILADLGFASVGLIEINDTTGINRGALAPLLQVRYF